MSWNYRVCKITENPHYIDEPIVVYGIHEVYYDENNDVVNISEIPMVLADDIEELKATLTKMIKCCEKPLLDHNTGEEIQELN